MKSYSFRIARPHFDKLMQHLFPGDNDEHGAVIVAGLSESERGSRLLAREVVLARDGIDYVPGTRGYRALTADFVARVSHRCSKERLCYFAVHNHFGSDEVEFSNDDLASHNRGYPALLDVTNGGPVGALVFATNSVAGEVWTRRGTQPLDHMVVVGPNYRRLFPSPRKCHKRTLEAYARQSLWFGASGQELFSNAKVGIIGLGGVGSLVNEWLARLGVGEIIAVDFDRIEPSNRSRVVGSTRWDSMDFLRGSSSQWLQRIGKRLSTHKVHIARRMARTANPEIRYDAVVGDITDESTARRLRDCDFLFLCADTASSRLVFNSLVHSFLIPGVQIGAKISIDRQSGAVNDVFAATRSVFPFAEGGCLSCNGLISSAQLQEEAISAEERRHYAYIDDVAVSAPSVLPLNALSTAPAIVEFMLGHLGLLQEPAPQRYLMNHCIDRRLETARCRAEENCIHCGGSMASIFARGDLAELPCKQSL